MSAFEYVTVLISVILGLGITQILTGIANLFQRGGKINIYWPHLLWVLFMLVLHIQEWWITYELRTYHPWRLPVFLFIMLYPVNLFVIAKMLFPIKVTGKMADLKKFYFDNYKKIFLLTIGSALLSVVYNLFILDLGVETQLIQLFLALVLAVIIKKELRQEWIHKTLSVTLILSLIISVIIAWDEWLVG